MKTKTNCNCQALANNSRYSNNVKEEARCSTELRIQTHAHFENGWDGVSVNFLIWPFDAQSCEHWMGQAVWALNVHRIFFACTRASPGNEISGKKGGFEITKCTHLGMGFAKNIETHKNRSFFLVHLSGNTLWGKDAKLKGEGWGSVPFPDFLTHFFLYWLSLR